ncbi:hypothetical protein Aph01nite_43820 [Acrocarpospora phusangensis]|uniref:Uncharacterized protein n=1 Tax=Acrocarpospora phusangensis TaxID=1070424 RepID=A0A919UPT6_9ACTN|nr:hypothetical protein [Acrocarpospora phusangensis]GIH26072.1 hypothetical protein Aph01nite_43820 [Acrocarpospora phusangensis]
MKVRTTIRPDQELDVDEAEYTDLQRQGLLLPGIHAEQFDIAEQVASEAAKPKSASKKEAE